MEALSFKRGDLVIKSFWNVHDVGNASGEIITKLISLKYYDECKSLSICVHCFFLYYLFSKMWKVGKSSIWQ